MPGLDFSTQEGNSAVHIVLSGELDISSVERLEEELGRLESGAPQQIVLDLRQLEFIDSSGVRLILGADARARERGARFTVVRGPGAVQRVFELTRLDERLEIVEDSAPA